VSNSLSIDLIPENVFAPLTQLLASPDALTGKLEVCPANGFILVVIVHILLTDRLLTFLIKPHFEFLNLLHLCKPFFQAIGHIVNETIEEPLEEFSPNKRSHCSPVFL
jgi:hypothetical protein